MISLRTASAVAVLAMATPTLGQGKFYFVGNAPGPDAIQRADLDGSNREIVVSGLLFPQDVAVDPVGGKVYWSDTDVIQRADLDGSNVETIVSTGGVTRGVAVDSINGKVYWTDYILQKIQRADLGGANVEDVASGLNIPSNLTLDVPGGKLYWTEQNDAELWCSDLDGANPQLLHQNANWGVAVDPVGGKLYWGGTGVIRQSNLDGSDPGVLTAVQGSADGMAIDPLVGKLYWVNGGPSQINRINLDGTGKETLLPNLSTPLGIDLDLSACPPPATAAVLDYGCGVNPAGSLTVIDGRPALGTEFVLGVDNPLGTQPAGATPFLVLAAQPGGSFPCGVSIPGWGMAGPGAPGELLFDPAAPHLAASGPAWNGAGSPAPFALNVPTTCVLLGGELFVQGLIFDPAGSAGVRFGLTTAKRLTLGR